jgi:transposase InsO family protein
VSPRPRRGAAHHNKYGIEGSMSAMEDSCDNDVVESFFGALKSEQIHWQSYQT